MIVVLLGLVDIRINTKYIQEKTEDMFYLF